MITKYTNERTSYFKELLAKAASGEVGRFDINLSSLYNDDRFIVLMYKISDENYTRIEGAFENDFPQFRVGKVTEDKEDIAIYLHEHNALIIKNSELAKIIMKYCTGIKVYSKELYKEVYEAVNQEFAFRAEVLNGKYTYTDEEFNDTLDYLYEELLNAEVKGETTLLSESLDRKIINDNKIKELLLFYLGNPVVAVKQFVDDIIASESEYISKAVKREFLKHLVIRVLNNRIAGNDLVLKAKKINQLFKNELKETGRVYVTTHSGTVKIVRKNLWLLNLTEMYVGDVNDINVKDIVVIEWEGKKFDI
ncbi:hypothetical protein O0Q50_22315 [Priestia aryabhattai]|uniref:Uncharacterized protein n=1 Tax=Priestia aryabhattai TaxID=412384 RepID=A0AAX6NDM4_PRIAR|nr:hypothetical protein [Priestia aryabhattai]MDU9693919.1 hypothetical protein [Priestia aryabhattai]